MKRDVTLAAADALYALIVRAGEDARRLRDVLGEALPDDAVLVSLLRRAAVRPKRRIPTRPTKASKARRLDSKAKRSRTKKLRTARPSQE